MEKILQAGRLAPTAKNSQSQRIFVLKSPEALKKINEATPMAFNAPVVLMVCYDQNESYKNAADTAYTYYPGGHYDGGEVDASIVTSAMMFQATELGLGTLWAPFGRAALTRPKSSRPLPCPKICIWSAFWTLAIPPPTRSPAQGIRTESRLTKR